ncbi:MAG: hypothetical protein H6993_11530 [Pseudomonadales bacterium]|nr:hypothetical protein [Pseudomonadales bacterium]MCP5184586.1 hypothetical protein [Pseudomonadales bacterium]
MSFSESDLQAYNAAVARILRRLARLSLRHGQAYDAFAELTKRVFVEVAEEEFPIEGRKVSDSRIATLTGMHRKEVARLRKLSRDSDEETGQRRNRAARVLNAWLRDAAYHDSKGDPLDLPLEGTPSFVELVRGHSGDIPPRAIADELLRLGAIQVVNNRYRLASRSVEPSRELKELFEVLGTDTAELMDALDQNMTRPEGTPPLYQQKVVYNNVPVEYVDVFRKLSKRMGQRLVEEIDRWLADHDRDHNPDVLGSGRASVGLMLVQLQRIIEQEGEDGGGGDAQ